MATKIKQRETAAWTSQEDEVLTRVYTEQGADAACAALGSKRTIKAIHHRAQKLALVPRSRWLPEEIRLLRGMVEDGLPLEDIALHLKRTPKAVHLKADRLMLITKQLRLDRMRNTDPIRTPVVRWQPHEDEILRTHYATESLSSIQRLFPARSRASIAIRASSLLLTAQRSPTNARARKPSKQAAPLSERGWCAKRVVTIS